MNAINVWRTVAPSLYVASKRSAKVDGYSYADLYTETATDTIFVTMNNADCNCPEMLIYDEPLPEGHSAREHHNCHYARQRGMLIPKAIRAAAKHVGVDVFNLGTHKGAVAFGQEMDRLCRENGIL